ncbi:hypothetical protein KUTeg_022177, partial [Tegillarca granosa]
MQLVGGYLAAGLDVKSTFRLLFIHSADFKLFGYKIRFLYFIDKCFFSGCSISCFLFEKFFSHLLNDIAKICNEFGALLVHQKTIFLSPAL